jgi:hypothetical protein
VQAGEDVSAERVEEMIALADKSRDHLVDFDE